MFTSIPSQWGLFPQSLEGRGSSEPNPFDYSWPLVLLRTILLLTTEYLSQVELESNSVNLLLENWFFFSLLKSSNSASQLVMEPTVWQRTTQLFIQTSADVMCRVITGGGHVAKLLLLGAPKRSALIVFRSYRLMELRLFPPYALSRSTHTFTWACCLRPSCACSLLWTSYWWWPGSNLSLQAALSLGGPSIPFIALSFSVCNF